MNAPKELAGILESFTISCSRASPRSSGKTMAGTKRPGREPALLKEERDALHSIVICSSSKFFS